MRLSLFVSIFLTIVSGHLFAAAENPSALNALKLLPRGEAKKVARIEARDGTPVPERWHILVHDPKEETGVHEYVVAGGEVVASRSVSQFAEFLKEEDIVGAGALRVDTDKLAKLAQEYAFANNVTIASLNYALKKEGADAAPLWSVSCLDEKGNDVGHLVVSAGKGNVVSHEGFALQPTTEPRERPRTQIASRFERDERRRPLPMRGRSVGPPSEEKNDVLTGLRKFFTGH